MNYGHVGPAARIATIALLAGVAGISIGFAEEDNEHNGCAALPRFAALQSALSKATKDESSGLNNHMWATIVDRDGVACVVAYSGTTRGAQWPGSRVISAQKANTANSFSLDHASFSNLSGQAAGLALSTANLYTAVQSGGSLFGLQFSNPVDPSVAYAGPSLLYGTASDPMVGRKPGGVNVFGGGLALYAVGGNIVGGLGVSGDTSCADHDIAWRVRNYLDLDHLAGVGGVSGDAARPDNIKYDIVPNPDATGGTGQSPSGSGGVGTSPSGFGHPKCLNTADPSTLPVVRH